MDAWLPPKAGFVVEGDRIRADGSVRRKVTGTSMGGILRCSPWSSPFQVACQLLGLADKDISTKPAVVAGQICEEPIIRYAGKAYSDYGEFIPAKEIYGVKKGSHEEWPSDFEDEVFAGHVDGIVIDGDGRDHILEIKTSGNMDMWSSGVPSHYYWQVALYNQFVAKSDMAYLVLGIMDQASVADPASWTPSPDNTTLFHVPMDMEATEEVLDTVREWYHEYIEQGVTPPYDPSNRGDIELYTRLVGLAGDEDSITAMLAEYVELDRRIAAHEDEIRGDYDARDALKDSIKEWMTSRDVMSLDTPDGELRATIGLRRSEKIDKKRMAADGIDVEKYTTTTLIKTMTVKPVKH